MLAAKGNDRQLVRRRPARTLAIIAFLSLLFGVIGMGEVVEDSLRTSRNSLRPANASGQVVLLEIDERSQKEVGSWPWKRSVQAKLVDRIDAANPKQILFDLSYDFPTEAREDQAFADALRRSGKVVLPVQLRRGDWKGNRAEGQPIPMFQKVARMGSISVYGNYQVAVWKIHYAFDLNGKTIPSFASLIGGRTGQVSEEFPVDYRYRMASIPHFSVSDVLQGRVDPAQLRGKTIIIGSTAPTLGDRYTIPGRGRYGGVFAHIYGGETLKHGRPVDFGWLPALLAGLLIAAASGRAARARSQMLVLAAGAALLVSVPILTEPLHYFLDITTGLFVLVSAAIAVSWRRFRASGYINARSGLPNLNAFKSQRPNGDGALIVARVLNYAQLTATLDDDGERMLIEQIVARLAVGAPKTTIYQGDDGVFAWFGDPGVAVGHHVEALHSLFRSPARIAKVSYDLSIAFGVEVGSGRSIANRLGSALVAADEAANEGLKWKYHDPERFKDESWRLSLLAQLDEAIDNGEVWVAYQPQLDLSTGRIRGAEALARWTHPEKGPISPVEFVTAAEQHGRIDRLTLFMLDRSIAAAARLNREGHDFSVSVNLSPRTLARRTLPSEVRGFLDQHRLDPRKLTLELTETAALASDGSDLDPLLRLRDLGVDISIDDYGTGMSTLEYLKKIPAKEIKIDQSFIRSMNDTRSDLVMVQSTIALAHSLGRSVVAEGVENDETLTALKAMKCDVAQGYLIGRPMSYEGVLRRLNLQKKGRAA